MSGSHDAVVLGGGPGGTTAALLLARAGWSVALVERKAFPRRKVCGEYLSATNRPLFRRLGLEDLFDATAGPEVCRVGLFAASDCLDADLPCPGGWGRALARDRLDPLLLDSAARAGVEVLQPWQATGLTRTGAGYLCRARSDNGAETELRAPVVVLAHGSWDVTSLPTQQARGPARGSDLFGFKAHFRESALAPGLMPLLAFPGGYGGMVHCDGGRVSISCCVRRDVLQRLRAGSSLPAGDVVQAYLESVCLGVRRALDGATRDGSWLAAGPIRPGVRVRPDGGLFAVGNAAGEAHPVVAEGISMAMQSAWLLTRRLTRWRQLDGDPRSLPEVGGAYARAWRGAFVPRLTASVALAQWAMRTSTLGASLPLVRRWPRLLTWGARWSGKATRVVY